MYKWLVLFLFTLVQLHAAPDFSSVRNYLEQWQTQGGTPSGQVSVFIGEQPIFEESFGCADRTLGTHFSSEQQFLTLSISKQVTAAALLNLIVESGFDPAWILHLPLGLLLDKEHPVWSGHQPSWTMKVSLHQLLTHTSGLIDPVEIPLSRELKGPVNGTFLEYMQWAVQLPQSLKKQGEFVYSPLLAYNLLGLLIENFTEQPLETYLQETLFEPLGMKNTCLITTDTLIAKPYLLEATQEEWVLVEPFPYHLVWAAGGVVSTPNDLVKWNNWLYNNPLIAYIAQDYVPEARLVPQGLQEAAYGYGLYRSGQNCSYYWHAGGALGFRNFLMYIPKYQLSVVMVRNLVADPSCSELDEGLDFFNIIFQALQGMEQEQEQEQQ